MSQAKRDYYEVLGLGRDADEGTIKKAYRKLAIEYHPDRNPDNAEAAERFKEATEAYKVLSDSQQRRIFDAYGHAGLEGAGYRGFSNMEEVFQSFDLFGSVLGDLFGLGGRGRSRGGRQQMRGRNVRVRVPLTFADSFSGLEKELALTDRSDCPQCRGSGAAAGGVQQCRHCNGTGQVTQRSGFFALATPCVRCGGRGQQVTKPCGECEGRGHKLEKRTVKVRIPPGVDNGDSMGVPGEGEAGLNGGARGDLILVFEVEPDGRFQRDGLDLHMEVPVSFFQAALGEKVEVAGIDGPVSVRLEPGTQPGETIRLTRRGMPDPNGGRRGSLVCHVRVVVPKELNRSQRRALEELRRALEE